MQNKNTVIFIDKLLNFVPGVLALITPLFFLPFTTEYFEFNKHFLIVTATIVMFVLWTVKIFFNQKLHAVKSIIDLPLILFLGVVVLSTIFSINKTSSIYGSYGRWFPSLFGYLSLIVFYYVTSANVKSSKVIKSILALLITGTTLSSLIAIMSYFGLYISSAAFAKVSTFNPTGSVTVVTILSALNVVLLINTLIAQKSSLMVKVLGFTFLIVNFFWICLVQSFQGWFIVISGVAAILYVNRLRIDIQNKITSALVLGSMLTLALILNVSETRKLFVNENFPKEINLSVKDSWIISSSVIQDYPLLATGPSTFRFNFTRYRPISLNNGVFWNIRFDRPYNELFNILASTGILGIVVVLLLAIKIVKLCAESSRSSESYSYTKTLSIGILTVLLSYFVSCATVLTSFVLFLLLGLLVAALSQMGSPKVSEEMSVSLTAIGAVSSLSEMSIVKKEYFHYVVVIPMLALSVYSGYLTYRNYLAERYMKKSIDYASINDGTKTYEYQMKAINASPNRDVYHMAYAQTNLALANSIASKENMTDADKQAAQTLVSQAITTSRVATEVVSPLNVSAWETRASIYRSITQVADNAFEWAAASYNTAIQLDPSNPTLRLDLGGIYFAKEDYLSAANQFKQAVVLKPDYANARYNLAQALVKLQDYTNALNELEIVKTLIPQDSKDYELLAKEIETLKNQPSVAGAKDQKPSVEQLEQTTKQKTDQEPLNKVGTETQPVEVQENK